MLLEASGGVLVDGVMVVRDGKTRMRCEYLEKKALVKVSVITGLCLRASDIHDRTQLLFNCRNSYQKIAQMVASRHAKAIMKLHASSKTELVEKAEQLKGKSS
jgi:hypothetical protein